MSRQRSAGQRNERQGNKDQAELDYNVQAATVLNITHKLRGNERDHALDYYLDRNKYGSKDRAFFVFPYAPKQSTYHLKQKLLSIQKYTNMLLYYNLIS